MFKPTRLNRSVTEPGGSSQIPAEGSAGRQDQLDTVKNDRMSSLWGAGGTVGRAPVFPDIVGPGEDRPANSDGATDEKPDGESLDVFGRRVTYRVVNYASAMPVVVMGKIKRKVPSVFGKWEGFAQFKTEAINFAKIHGCEVAFPNENSSLWQTRNGHERV